MDRSANAYSQGMRQMAEQLAKWWWLLLIVGALWLIAAIVILQFQAASIVTVGIVIGVVLLATGIQELFMASIAEDWKWLWIVFGVILVIGGVYALVNPVGTFVALAQMLGFLFLLIGILWMIGAIATRESNDLWVLGLVSGIIMIALGFWLEGQFFDARAATLLFFVGIWALFQGITDIVRAFHLKNLGPTVSRRLGGVMGTS